MCGYAIFLAEFFKKDLQDGTDKWYYIFILIVGGKYGKRFT